MASKMKSDFEVFQEMSEQNLDIGVHLDALNFQRDKLGGKVTFGIADPHFSALIKQAGTGKQTHYVAVYVANKEQFDKIKNRKP